MKELKRLIKPMAAIKNLYSKIKPNKQLKKSSLSNNSNKPQAARQQATTSTTRCSAVHHKSCEILRRKVGGKFAQKIRPSRKKKSACTFLHKQQKNKIFLTVKNSTIILQNLS